jgi:hypothetical protein
MRLFKFIDLRRRPTTRSRCYAGYFGSQGAATTIGRIAHPPREPEKTPHLLTRSRRSTSVAEEPMAIHECMPSLELWECAAPGSGLPG